jgi:hypothetical protein
MGRKKSRRKIVLNQVGQAACVVLEALEASSAALPPLQSVAGGALYISKLVRV